MSEQENQQGVRTMFEAFGRGDVPAMLGVVSDEVDWAITGPSSVPYYGERKGHQGVIDFVTQLGSNVEFEKFEPGKFIASGDNVIVLDSERGRVRGTGKTFDTDWAIVFTVRDGKITNFRCYENTAAVSEAFRQ
ncbi:MAG: nuclear transport factor 2 family protein [Acidobacteria bacterium]|nr:nuclear transport factor 2 family protein [Acidobacteriota bacterium]